MSDQMTCPRRGEGLPAALSRFPKRDTWNGKVGHRTCSWCGSLHPDDFMDAVMRGVELGPTDKNYKTYVDQAEIKFYFQHLGEEQRREFVDLYNRRARRKYGDGLDFTVVQDEGSPMAVGYPGYFYSLPFFMRSAAAVD